MKLAQLLQRNRELGRTLTGERYRIALVSNIVVNLFKEPLELALREEGVNAEVVLGDYNVIVQETARLAGADAVIVFWEACSLVEDFEDRAWLLTDAEMAALETRVETELALVVQHLQQTPLVLINTFSSMLFDASSLRESPLRRLCSRVNLTLKRSVAGNQTIVDLDAIIAELGVARAADYRQFQLTRALYSIEFSKAYAAAVRPAFLSATGLARKVLVLDCDNTLWAGVLGEDGASGIDMSATTARGRPFHEVQTIVQGLQRKGVLLALCSKNDLSDVMNVVQSHPDMLLKDEDFVAKKVNWLDKATNLQALSLDLNLGLDSFVFVDDSAFELGLVQEQLSAVRCVQVPDNVSDYPPLMRQLRNEFFSLSITAEDVQKTAMYRADVYRKGGQGRFASMEAYLASLGLQATISWGDAVAIPRAAQLTQKTNQFNVTTRRYTEADIRRMLHDPSYQVATLGVSDRYGDYGITGLAICRRSSTTIHTAAIDTFLMSCRIIGRNVEYAFFDQVVERLLAEGYRRMEAEYVATPKNDQVSAFYEGLGMIACSANADRKHYTMDLDDYRPRSIDYIQVMPTTERI